MRGRSSVLHEGALGTLSLSSHSVVDRGEDRSWTSSSPPTPAHLHEDGWTTVAQDRSGHFQLSYVRRSTGNGRTGPIESNQLVVSIRTGPRSTIFIPSQPGYINSYILVPLFDCVLGSSVPTSPDRSFLFRAVNRHGSLPRYLPRAL